MTFLVDSHCHLQSLSYSGKAGTDPAQILGRARSVGVTHFLSISCTTKEFKKDLEIAAPYPDVYLAAGIHPLNLEDDPDWKDEELISCINSSPKVIGLGETGLDYHYAPETRKAQLESFSRQIGIALELKKPLIVHAREAHRDAVALLRSENARDCGGVIHCFTDSVEMARECLDLGFYISFTGIATFKASDNVRQAVRYVPDDRIMVETDCPYLAPVPVRGVENEPAFVRYTLDFLSAFRGVSQEYLAMKTSQNFEKLYGVKLEEPKEPIPECSSWKLEKIWHQPFATAV
ncbi:MAG: TatD family hydrolase [Succinivibrio sp.]|jgi:TatD DNase family protein|nr:TatD family hydrolase [Succinivibrio sp.]